MAQKALEESNNVAPKVRNESHMPKVHLMHVSNTLIKQPKDFRYLDRMCTDITTNANDHSSGLLTKFQI